MKQGEETEISKLVVEVFDEFVGSEFSEKGRETFMSHADADRIRSGFEKGNILLAARNSGNIAGVIEVMNGSHICMLFVDRKFHGKGVAKALWKEAKKQCAAKDPSLSGFTVNASTFAIPVYEKLGFRKTTEKLHKKNGFVFTPMKFQMGEDSNETDRY